MSPHPETVGERIRDLIESIPAKEGRRARLKHISIDDFAELVGTTRQRVIAWMKKENPSYPDPTNRERLAAVSGGRYLPEDFRGPTRADELVRLAALEDLGATNAGNIEELRIELEAQKDGVRELDSLLERRLDELESRVRALEQ